MVSDGSMMLEEAMSWRQPDLLKLSNLFSQACKVSTTLVARGGPLPWQSEIVARRDLSCSRQAESTRHVRTHILSFTVGVSGLDCLASHGL